MNNFTDEETTMLAREAVEMAIKRKELRKEPIAFYDKDKGVSVLVYPDGTREVMQRLRKGRYSERANKKREITY
jgi:hypothetical protein